MTLHTSLREANIARQQEWDQGRQITTTYRATELAGEVREACNVVKKLERERLGIAGSRATKADLANELADVIICADLVAMGEDIDLQRAVIEKFNETSEKVGLQTRLGLFLAPSYPAAIRDVISERSRQIVVEGYSAEADDRGHGLVQAARAYIKSAMGRAKQARAEWPPSWMPEMFKPKGRRRDLVRAAALIIAEIERLDRAADSAEARP